MQESLPTSVKTLTRLKATASQPVNNSVSFEKICDDIVSAAKNKVGGAVVVPWWYPRGGTLSERAICDPSAALPALPPLPHLDDLCPVFVSIRDTQSVGQIWSSARRLFFVRQEYRDHQGQHSDLYTRRFLTTLMDIVDAQNQKALAFVALAILPANVGILDDALRPQDSAGPRSVVDLSRNGQVREGQCLPIRAAVHDVSYCTVSTVTALSSICMFPKPNSTSRHSTSPAWTMQSHSRSPHFATAAATVRSTALPTPLPLAT